MPDRLDGDLVRTVVVGMKACSGFGRTTLALGAGETQVLVCGLDLS